MTGTPRRITTMGDLTTVCSLCGVTMSTGDCNHLIDFGDGRVGMKRSEWESLIEDWLRLRDKEVDEEGLLKTRTNRYCPPGQIIVVNNDAMDEAIRRVVSSLGADDD